MDERGFEQAARIAEAQRESSVAVARLALDGSPSSGICRSCGEPVGTKRLAAMPNAIYCVACLEGG